MTLVRSLLFNVAFYAVTAIFLIVTAPVLVLPRSYVFAVMRAWARVSLFLLRAVAGTRVEMRGLENRPTSGAIIAVKHQSAFETFALIPLLGDPAIVMKREIQWIPIFGQFTTRAGMIHVDRRGQTRTLHTLAEHARKALAAGRQVLIFPEGSRRPPGAEASYQSGIGWLYRRLNVPVVPVALNSGLFWPRRSFVHYPGTIVVELLPPIPPGLPSRTFLQRLQTDIEAAADRLLEEAGNARPRPPFPPEAAARRANHV